MTLIDSKDYVLSPKSTVLINGINTCVVLGTRRYLFLFPIQNLQGAGSRMDITTSTIGGGSALEAIKAKCETVSKIEELETWLLQLIQSDLNLPEEHVIEVGGLLEFNIKTGLLSSGVYYQTPQMKRRNAIGGMPKQSLLAFKEFYGK